jgi:hypothetical protein
MKRRGIGRVVFTFSLLPTWLHGCFSARKIHDSNSIRILSGSLTHLHVNCTCRYVFQPFSNKHFACPFEGVQLLHGVIEDLFAIVETSQPAFDTTPYREKIWQSRGVWDQPPGMYPGFQAKVFCTHLNVDDHTVFVNEKCDPMSKTPGAVVFCAHLSYALFNTGTYASTCDRSEM